MKRRITSLHYRPERLPRIMYRGIWRNADGKTMMHSANTIAAVKAVMATTGWLFWHPPDIKTFWYYHPFSFDDCKTVIHIDGHAYGFPRSEFKRQFAKQFDIDLGAT